MSSGSTPILGLPIMDALDDIDFNELNAANNQLDRLPPTVCTSATRPNTNLFVGRYIWETDTKRVYMWDGAVWRWVSSESDDTGWLDIVVQPTFAAMAGNEKAQVRRIGREVRCRGGFLSTGMAINNSYTVGQMPAGQGLEAAVVNEISGIGSSAGNATASGFVTSGGQVIIRTGAVLGVYYKLTALSYWND